VTPLAYRFRPLSVSDLPLVSQWLSRPHVTTAGLCDRRTGRHEPHHG
jgi:hypothetical protein